MKKLFIAMALVGNVVFGKDLKECTLGILTPFEMNQDAQKIPEKFKSELNGDSVIPTEYLEYLKTKNIFKDVIAINGDKTSDYYIKGYIESVGLGSAAARYWLGTFGAGRAYIKEKVSILDSNKKLIDEQEIYQEGRGAGVAWRAALWSNTINLRTAAEATKIVVYNLVLKSIVKGDSSNIKSLLTSGNYEVMREVSKQVKAGKISRSKKLEEAYTIAIDKYISHPDADEMAIDALAWVCMAIGSAKMTNNAGDVEKLIHADVSPKIQKHARATLEILKGS